jgi:hypothetical protein
VLFHARCPAAEPEGQTDLELLCPGSLAGQAGRGRRCRGGSSAARRRRRTDHPDRVTDRCGNRADGCGAGRRGVISVCLTVSHAAKPMYDWLCRPVVQSGYLSLSRECQSVSQSVYLYAPSVEQDGGACYKLDRSQAVVAFSGQIARETVSTEQYPASA